MAKKAKMTLKTAEHKSKDWDALEAAKVTCCDAVIEFSTDLWNSEWKVKYLALGVFNTIDEAADQVKCARARLLEEYVTDDWSKLTVDERRNATHIHRYS